MYNVVSVLSDTDHMTGWLLYLHPPPRMDHSLHDSPPHLWPGTATGSKWDKTTNDGITIRPKVAFALTLHNNRVMQSLKYIAHTV